jgi:hypothetical protein
MKKVSVGMVIMLALCWSATAAVIVTEDFAGGLNGWVIDDASDGSGGAPYGTITDGGGYYRVDSGNANGGNIVDYAFDGGGVFAGDYRSTANGGGGLAANGINGISFNFYNPAATAIPELSVYLVAGGNTWYHALTTVDTTGGWGNYGANLSYDSLNAGTGNWFTLAGDNLATWQSDLANVTGMGFRMLYDTSANQIYGLDDIIIQDDPYILLVPEPQTYAMLGFAFLSLGVTFRRRLEDALSSLKAMVA